MAKIFPPVSEFDAAGDAQAHDDWFRAEVEMSLNDPRPSVPHDEAMRRIRNIIEAKKQSPG
jgi:hypothetical protein